MTYRLSHRSTKVPKNRRPTMLAAAVTLTAVAAPLTPRYGLRNDTWWTRKAIWPARASRKAITIDQNATVCMAWDRVQIYI